MKRAGRVEPASRLARWLARTAALAVSLPAVVWAAPQPSAAVEVFGGGGYDSNLFLLVAADPDSPTYRPYAGGFLRLAPVATLALSGDTLRVELRAGADVRQTFGSGALLLEDGQLTLIRPEVGPFDLRVGLNGARFDATIDQDLRFSSVGALLEMAWRPFDRWRISTSYRLTARWFGAPARVGVDRDVGQDAQLRAAFSPRAVSQVAVSAGYVDLRSMLDGGSAPSTGTTSQFQRLWTGLDGAYTPATRLTLFASVWAGAMRPDGDPAELQVGGAAAASLRLLESLEAILRYEGLVDRRSAGSTESDGFQLHVITAGLLWRTGTRRRAGPARAPLRAEEPVASGTTVRFTLRAPGAATVAVVGSWNDWAQGVPSQTMRATGAAQPWETTLVLPPGTHRFQFVVDGRVVPPPAAERYQDDDFGGRDGIVVVDAPP